MTRHKILQIFAIAVALSSIKVLADNSASDSGENESVCIERPSISSYCAEIGSASILDTYLTPIRYHGINTRLSYEGMRAMGFNPERWIMQGVAAIEYANVQNQPGNHTMHSLMIEGKWGMMLRRHNVFTPKLTLMIGGSTQLRGGAIYNSNNSNNPVSAKIRWSLNLSAMATYRLRLHKLPVTLRYQATLPVIGAFFSLDYGEAFYELYLGNTKGIVNVGWWGNRFDMENLVTADLHFGKSILRIGYRNLIETSYVHNLNTQIFTHGFMIGVSGEWLKLTPGKKTLSERTKIISAMY